MIITIVNIVGQSTALVWDDKRGCGWLNRHMITGSRYMWVIHHYPHVPMNEVR